MATKKQPCTRWTVQVQAQFEVDCPFEDEARERAVEIAVGMEGNGWGTVILESGPCEPARKGKRA